MSHLKKHSFTGNTDHDFSGLQNNYLSKLNSTGTGITNSIAYDDGTNIGIGTSSPLSKLHIQGLTSDYSSYALRVDNSTNNVFSVRDDNFVFVGNSNQDSYLYTQGLGGVFRIANESGFHRAEISSTNGRFYISNGSSGGNAYALLNTQTGNWVLGSPNTSIYNYSTTGVKLNLQSETIDSSSYALKIQNSGATDIFSVRSDGLVKINNINVGYPITSTSGVLDTSSTVFGAGSLENNTTGNQNSVFGYQSGAANTTGNYNSFFGLQSGNNNLSANNNTAIGYQTLLSNSIGTDNTALGYRALFQNKTSYNTAIGSGALYNTTSGGNNVAVGYNAGFNASTASKNTLVGFGAGYYNTGDENTAIGYEALLVNTTGTLNTAVGSLALSRNTTGYANVAVGYAGAFITTASQNTALGYAALVAVTTGNQNTAIGSGAMQVSNGAATSNTAVGVNSLAGNSGNENTAIGFNSGSASSGGANVFLGAYAGRLETGNYKLFIDSISRASEAEGRTNSLITGTFASAPANQYLRFNANVGIGVDALDKLHISGGTIRINTLNSTEGAGKLAVSDVNGSISFSSTTDLNISLTTTSVSKYTTTTTLANTGTTITHNLNTNYIICSFYDVSGNPIIPTYQRTGVNTISVTAATTGTYDVVIHG